MKEIKSNYGFTLIELLVGILVLSISLLAVIPLLGTSLSLDSSTSLKAKAEMFSIERLHRLQFMPQGSVDLLTLGTYSLEAPESFKGVNLQPSFKFDMISINTGTRPPSYIITVKVDYSEKGVAKTVFFSAPWIRK